MQKFFYLLSFFLLSAVALQAQIRTPQPSPTGKVSQEVGLGRIEIEYSRPSAKGRKVFGKLVPYGEMWRTGANASTKVTFSDDAKVGSGQISIAKGTYALYTTPGEKEWTIIFYKNTSFGGVPSPKDFKEEDVAVRIAAPVQSTPFNTETFTIAVNNLRNNGADIQLMWENTLVSIPVTFDVDTRVESAIKSVMEGPSAGDYQAAANYYYTEKKDMNKALEWVNKSLEKGGDKFWILRLKANILAELGRYKDAIGVAEKSTELAKQAGNADYPRMNDESIAMWKKKM